MKPVQSIHEKGLPAWKRAMDIAIATTALILLAPVMILVVLAIKIESRGPVFYVSKRIGAGFREFDFYKFRSMYVNADRQVNSLKSKNQYAKTADNPAIVPSRVQLLGDTGFMDEGVYNAQMKLREGGTFLKIKRDPRITRVGMFIRNTSIDELPQLVNVLKGDMSIVGNRPLPPYEAEKLTRDHVVGRFMAPAGITGLWQTEGRGESEVSETERKALDLKYAEQYNFWMDIRILMKTLPSMIQRETV